MPKPRPVVLTPEQKARAIDQRNEQARSRKGTPRCTCGNAAYEQMYDYRVPCRPDCQMRQAAS
jgi:hypothetical protein